MAVGAFWQFYSYIKESQTLLGLLQFTVTLLSWGVIVGYADKYYSADKKNFQCEKAGDITNRYCFKEYANLANPLMSPFTFLIVVGVIPLILWVVFGIAIVIRMSSPYIVMQMPKPHSKPNDPEMVVLQQDQEQPPELEETEPKQPKLLYKVFCLHVLLRLGLLLFSLILFLAYQKLDLPSHFSCKFKDVPFNCTDFNSSKKAEINYGVVVVTAILMLLAITELAYLGYLPRRFHWKLWPNDEEFSSLLKGKLTFIYVA